MCIIQLIIHEWFLDWWCGCDSGTYEWVSSTKRIGHEPLKPMHPVKLVIGWFRIAAIRPMLRRLHAHAASSSFINSRAMRLPGSMVSWNCLEVPARQTPAMPRYRATNPRRWNQAVKVGCIPVNNNGLSLQFSKVFNAPYNQRLNRSCHWRVWQQQAPHQEQGNAGAACLRSIHAVKALLVLPMPPYAGVQPGSTSTAVVTYSFFAYA